ncbi:hypothetical protein L227DRAFT_284715 [Lentinus tigrinus ALCF2SS1-6]|uniref:Uncharacterized protein n=1 Tax=Lentinus tigrinus ALCF2SS1-6 TaxID=1328759 RepID=A0A5C2RZA2_9APHY|nr:hypothetical protein L227DRAFT_284715 [Lentinus tigrinus ALCF2SS1-6]
MRMRLRTRRRLSGTEHPKCGTLHTAYGIWRAPGEVKPQRRVRMGATVCQNRVPAPVASAAGVGIIVTTRKDPHCGRRDCEPEGAASCELRAAHGVPPTSSS